MMIFQACQGSVQSMGFTPDGETLIISGRDATLKLWSPPVLIRELPMKGREVVCFALNSGGELLALALGDGSLYLHHLTEGTFSPLPRHKLPITSMGFMQNNRRLVVGVGDLLKSVFVNGPISLIELDRPQSRPFPVPASNGIRSLAVHDQRLVAWATDSRSLGCRDLYKADPILTKKLKVDCRRLAFSPDGKWLAAAMDWRVEAYAMDQRPEPRVFSGHKGVVTALAFTPDGKHLMTSSWDQTVKWWDAETGEEQASYQWQIGRMVEVVVAPDGLRAAAGSDQGQVVVWDLG